MEYTNRLHKIKPKNRMREKKKKEKEKEKRSTIESSSNIFIDIHRVGILQNLQECTDCRVNYMILYKLEKKNPKKRFL